MKKEDLRMKSLLAEHARKQQDHATLEAYEKQTGEAVPGGLEHGSANARAAAEATARLKELSVEDLKAGTDEYKRLLEQRDLADVAGFG